jgi:2-polyprenyl-6-methoxyphenol hydroxylase-like FAD-dependent oxidoreductase
VSDTEKHSTTEVAIVGGGPVGLMLSLLLDFYGVRCVVFNSDDRVRWHPKGSSHNARTMEHYRRLGISAPIRRLGMPPDHPKDVAYLTRLSGFEIARFYMPSEIEVARQIHGAKQTDQTPEPMFRANQMYVEAFLLEHARKRPNITLRFGWRCDGFSQDDNRTSLRATLVARGQSEQWRASYLVGCDGGRSDVRHSLGIRYSGVDHLEQAYLGGRMIASYLRAPTLYRDHLNRRRAWMYWIVNPELRTTLFSLNGTDEFMFWTKPPDANAPPDNEAIRRAFHRCIGAEVPVEIIGHQPWTAGAALVAERFADRRIVLAGDAVHLFTPTGGFGMNTGMDDAANLAWKIAATLRGWGGARLLHSYEIERKPIAIRNTTAAGAIAKQVGTLEIPPRIEEDSPAGTAQRRELGLFVSTYLGAQFDPVGVELGARYDGSTIVISNGAPPTDSIVQYIPTGVPGGRAPHYWLGTGRAIGDSLFDRLGKGFTLLRLGPKPPAAESFAMAARARGVPLTIVDVPEDAARDLYGAALALVRPDQHIAWAGHAAPADADCVLARTTGI